MQHRCVRIACLLSACLVLAGCSKDRRHTTTPDSEETSAQTLPWIARSSPAPEQHATPLDTGTIRIEFDRPMKTGTWTYWSPPAGAGQLPPLMDPSANPWKSETVCEIAITALQPDTDYALQLNSEERRGFVAADGSALPVTVLRFSTRPDPRAGAMNDPALGGGPATLPAGALNDPRLAAAPSASPKPAVGAAKTTSPLIGQWVHESEGLTVRATFHADGRIQYTYAQGGETARETGTWTVEGEVLHINAVEGDPGRFRFSMPDNDTLDLREQGEAETLRLKRKSPRPAGAPSSPAPADALPAEAAKGITRFRWHVCYDEKGLRDASGKPLEVFRMLIPQGWQAVGGVEWKLHHKSVAAIERADLVTPAVLAFGIRSPDGRVAMQFYPEIKLADLSAAPAGQMGLFPRGSKYGGGISWPVSTPQAFLTDIVIPYQRGGIPGARLVEQKDLPDLAKLFARETALFNRAAGLSGVTGDIRAGMVTVDYAVGNTPYRETFVTALTYLKTPGITLWWPRFTVSARAPRSEFDAWQKPLMTCLCSFRGNTRWALEYMRIVDRNFRGIADVDAAVRRIDNEITANRARTNNQIHRDMYPRLAPFSEHRSADGHRGFLPTDLDHQVDADGNLRSGIDLPETPGWIPVKPYTKPE